LEKSLEVSRFSCIFATGFKKTIMAATVNNSRSREEVIAWWQRAKKRKAA